GRPGRRSVQQGGEDVGGHRTLGAGIPGSDQSPRRTQRGRYRLSQPACAAALFVVDVFVGEDLFGSVDRIGGYVQRVLDNVTGAAGDVALEDVAGVFDDVRGPLDGVGDDIAGRIDRILGIEAHRSVLWFRQPVMPVSDGKPPPGRGKPPPVN